MNIISLITTLNKLYPYLVKATAAVFPLTLAAGLEKAHAFKPGSNIDIIGYAYSVTFMQLVFYRKALLQPSVPRRDVDALKILIYSKENQIQFMINTYYSQATREPYQYNPSKYDFTMGGKFPNVFTSYAVTLEVAQLLEDICVRAYKNAFPEYKRSFEMGRLEGLHLVQVRNATKIRMMRRKNGFAPNLSPYPTGSNDTALSAYSHLYKGEGNTIQNGVDVTQLPGREGNISVKVATQAFDEQLRDDQFEEIFAIFRRIRKQPW